MITHLPDARFMVDCAFDLAADILAERGCTLEGPNRATIARMVLDAWIHRERTAEAHCGPVCEAAVNLDLFSYVQAPPEDRPCSG